MPSALRQKRLRKKTSSSLNTSFMNKSEAKKPADSWYVRHAIQGDLEAFEELVARYQQAVFNIAYYKSKNCFDAEDLSQDIFLAAFKALPTLKDPESFGSWLFGIAYNRCHKWYHRERNKIVKIQEVRRRLEQEKRLAQHAGEWNSSADEPAALTELLMKLPEQTRQIIKWKYLEGMSYQAIEKRLGIKPHQIDYLIRKGKKAMREHWKLRNRETQA